jgi:hypothetical protein
MKIGQKVQKSGTDTNTSKSTVIPYFVTKNTTLKMMLYKVSGGVLYSSLSGPLTDQTEQNNKLSDFIKSGVFFDQLNDY